MRMPTTARNLNIAKLHTYLAKSEASRPCTNCFLLLQTFDDRPTILNFITNPRCATPLIPIIHSIRHFYLLHFKFVRTFTLCQSPPINFTHFTNLKRQRGIIVITQVIRITKLGFSTTIKVLRVLGCCNETKFKISDRQFGLVG